MAIRQKTIIEQEWWVTDFTENSEVISATIAKVKQD